MPDFHGVALGMAPRDVRDRFDEHGKFDVEPAADDYKMRFFPEHAVGVTTAQFEFHMGALVAIRAELSPTDAFAKGDASVVTKAAVLHRTRAPESVHVDILARDCPTHHAEAERLVESGKVGP